MSFTYLTLYGHIKKIKSAEQQTIIHQYGDWYCTLAVDGLAVTFGTARSGLGGCDPAKAPPRCTKCNSSPINGQCTNFISFDVAI